MCRSNRISAAPSTFELAVDTMKYVDVLLQRVGDDVNVSEITDPDKVSQQRTRRGTLLLTTNQRSACSGCLSCKEVAGSCVAQALLFTWLPRSCALPE